MGRYNMNKNFITGLARLFKGMLLTYTLVVSTLAVFWSDGMRYWNDMAFIVWCLCIMIVLEIIDEKVK